MAEARRNRSALVLLGIGWVALVVGAVVFGLTRYEDRIAERSADALEAAGLSDLAIEVQGRDVIVDGVDPERRGAVAEALADVEGVREVEFGASRMAEDEPEVTVLGEQLTTSTAPPVEETTTTTTTTAPETTTTTAAPEEETTTTTEAEPAARTYVQASLEDGRFELSGVVPDSATAEALVTAANIAYAPFVTNNLQVDPGVEPEPWLAGAPTGITLLPMITEGTIRVEGDQIELSGLSPNPSYLAAFEATVAGVFGLENVTNSVEITNLEPPTFIAQMENGTLTLSGVLPDENFQRIIVGGAIAAYGQEHVVDQTEVVDGLYPSFWMYTMPGVFELFRPFPRYDFKVDQGVTSGALRGGASFEFASAKLTPQLEQLLTIGAAIMTRDLSLGLAVEGHTDSIGPDDFNQGLSEDRAQSAVDFLVAAGVSPDRLKVVGKGEQEPAASNRTDEGRAINRRVEFIFGPVAEVVGSG